MRISFTYILLVLFLVSSCSREEKTIKRTTVAMGTVVEVQVRGLDEETANKAINASFAEIRRLDTLFSTYLLGNEMWKINNSDSTRIKVDKEVFEMLKRCGQMWNETGGAFDIAIGNLIDLVGFEKDDPVLPPPQKIKEALQEIGWKKIQLEEPDILIKPVHVKISFNACVPGYAADRVADILINKFGINDFLVNTGGEIVARGNNWKIGIQHPRRQNELLNVVKIDGIGITTSGDYEQFSKKNGKRFTHIFNPATGYPANECESVTIISHDAFTADALSTGIFVLGPQKGMDLIEELPGTEALIVDTTGTVHKSSGFDKYLLR